MAAKPAEASEASAGNGLRAGRKLLQSLVHVKRIRPALVWLGAFLRQRLGPLLHTFPFRAPSRTVAITTDASTWGMGGVLSEAGVVLECFATPLSREDLRRFRASQGEGGQTRYRRCCKKSGW